MKALLTAALTAAIALPALTAPLAATAQDENPTWWQYVEGRRTYLHFSTQDSEDPGLVLDCERPRAGAAPGPIRVFMLSDRRVSGATTPMQIKAAAVVATYPAKAVPEEMYGGSELTASIPARAPVMLEFARTGRIKVTAAGSVMNPPVAPAATVAAFMKACLGR